MRQEQLDRVRGQLARAGLGGLSDRAIIALGVGCAALLALAAWRFWPAAGTQGADVDELVIAARSSDEVPAAQGSDPSTVAAAPATVVVHVVGAVHRPGVYALPEGSRVSDALAAAGGSIGEAALDAVNLARILSDGEQVHIPTADEVAAGAVGALSPGGAASSVGGLSGASGGKVDINRASAAELDALPGIGPSTAQKIVDDREKNGPFERIEDLMRVTGIGEKKFEALKDAITVG